MPSTCPDEALLVRVSLGERLDEEFASLEAHLDTCADCRRVVAAAASEQTIPASESYPALAAGAGVGRYVVEGLLGVGGMGIVYAVRDPALGRPVALKLLRTGNDPVSNARLAQEAQTMAKLSHPNLVPVFELGEWQERVYLAMELVDGLPLDAWCKAQVRPAAEVLRVMLEAGRGLAAAHAAGVVHRDFKPRNVLIGRDGRVRVTDFGLARVRRGDSRPAGAMLETQVGALLGTPAYMSPEQLDGQTADARSDQFSFCVTLVEALSGTRPFVAQDRQGLRRAMDGAPTLTGVPRRFWAALARGLSLDRERRFPSMDALFDALGVAQRRPRRMAGFAAAFALLALLGWGAHRALREEPQVVVLFAATDIPDGTYVTREMINQRKIPASYVTSSMIKPEAAGYILNQEVLVPLQSGDLLLWSQFASPTLKKLKK